MVDDNGDDLSGIEDDASEGASAGWLATLAQFDWLHIPGAVRAIARLVGGSGEAGAAWVDVVKAKGQQKAAAIRDETSARSATTKALTKAVAKRVVSDPAILQRADAYLVAEKMRKQENREGVATETVRLLTLEPPAADAREPEDDWLNVFTSFAEKASSSRMRAHWASVLAGEIRQSGSFSLTTLQMLSVVDKELAEIIEEAATWLVDDHFIPLLGKLSRGDHYVKLMKLDAIGFLHLGSTQFFDPNSIFTFNYGNRSRKLKLSGTVGVAAAIMSPAGKQVLNLVARTAPDSAQALEFSNWVIANGGQEIP